MALLLTSCIWKKVFYKGIVSAHNLIINTFIQSVKPDQYERFGYKFMRHLTPGHRYQFADDAAIISALESEVQVLLNFFSR